MKDDQPAQQVRCEEHHWVSTHQPGMPIYWIRRCDMCGRYDSEDMRREIAEARRLDTDNNTMPQWLRQRFSPRPFWTGDPTEGWAELSEADKVYWAHEAAAVKRAVARGGFKEQR